MTSEAGLKHKIICSLFMPIKQEYIQNFVNNLSLGYFFAEAVNQQRAVF
jgi:hypothetical protein